MAKKFEQSAKIEEIELKLKDLIRGYLDLFTDADWLNACWPKGEIPRTPPVSFDFFEKYIKRDTNDIIDSPEYRHRYIDSHGWFRDFEYHEILHDVKEVVSWL